MPIVSTTQAVAPVRAVRRAPLWIAARIAVCAALFTAAAWLQAARLTSLTDIDVWWHLRTGVWIMQHHSLPHTALFTQYSALPWSVSSWGFDAVLGILYKLLGLRAIPVLLMIAMVLIAGTLFLLAGGRRGNFWPAVLISLCAQFALSGLAPDPITYSVVLFALELLVLLHCRRTGATRPLFWLPALFLIWANVDWHCCFGLLAMILFLGTVVGEDIWRRSGQTPIEGPWQPLPVASVGLVTGLSVLALLLPPYSYHVFESAFANTFSKVAMQHFPDLRSIPFRQPQHYVSLLLAMAAFFLLGRQRSRDGFKLLLLILCAFLAFRFQREMWLMVVASVGLIGDALPDRDEVKTQFPAWPKLSAAVAVLVLFVAAVLHVPASSQTLMNKAADALPVRACEFIRQNAAPAPLFNSLQWGGFLTWELPDYPVVMDQRMDLYGDLAESYFKLMQGDIPLDTDPAFVGARTFLLDRNSALAKALVNFPNFKVLYRDQAAVVLLKQD